MIFAIPPDAPSQTEGTLAAIRLNDVGPASSVNLEFGERLDVDRRRQWSREIVPSGCRMVGVDRNMGKSSCISVRVCALNAASNRVSHSGMREARNWSVRVHLIGYIILLEGARESPVGICIEYLYDGWMGHSQYADEIRAVNYKWVDLGR